MTDHTGSPEIMPASIHGEPVVSAFRHLPLYGRLDDTYTVITRDTGRPVSAPRYSVFRARFAPALERWSIATEYPLASGLTWNLAAAAFAGQVSPAARS